MRCGVAVRRCAAVEVEVTGAAGRRQRVGADGGCDGGCRRRPRRDVYVVVRSFVVVAWHGVKAPATADASATLIGVVAPPRGSLRIVHGRQWTVVGVPMAGDHRHAEVVGSSGQAVTTVGGARDPGHVATDLRLATVPRLRPVAGVGNDLAVGGLQPPVGGVRPRVEAGQAVHAVECGPCVAQWRRQHRHAQRHGTIALREGTGRHTPMLPARGAPSSQVLRVDQGVGAVVVVAHRAVTIAAVVVRLPRQLLHRGRQVSQHLHARILAHRGVGGGGTRAAAHTRSSAAGVVQPHQARGAVHSPCGPHVRPRRGLRQRRRRRQLHGLGHARSRWWVGHAWCRHLRRRRHVRHGVALQRRHHLVVGHAEVGGVARLGFAALVGTAGGGGELAHQIGGRHGGGQVQQVVVPPVEQELPPLCRVPEPLLQLLVGLRVHRQPPIHRVAVHITGRQRQAGVEQVGQQEPLPARRHGHVHGPRRSSRRQRAHRRQVVPRRPVHVLIQQRPELRVVQARVVGAGRGVGEQLARQRRQLLASRRRGRAACVVGGCGPLAFSRHLTVHPRQVPRRHSHRLALRIQPGDMASAGCGGVVVGAGRVGQRDGGVGSALEMPHGLPHLRVLHVHPQAALPHHPLEVIARHHATAQGVQVQEQVQQAAQAGLGQYLHSTGGVDVGAVTTVTVTAAAAVVGVVRVRAGAATRAKGAAPASAGRGAAPRVSPLAVLAVPPALAQRVGEQPRAALVALAVHQEVRRRRASATGWRRGASRAAGCGATQQRLLRLAGSVRPPAPVLDQRRDDPVELHEHGGGVGTPSAHAGQRRLRQQHRQRPHRCLALGDQQGRHAAAHHGLHALASSVHRHQRRRGAKVGGRVHRPYRWRRHGRIHKLRHRRPPHPLRGDRVLRERQPDV